MNTTVKSKQHRTIHSIAVYSAIQDFIDIEVAGEQLGILGKEPVEISNEIFAVIEKSKKAGNEFPFQTWDEASYSSNRDLYSDIESRVSSNERMMREPQLYGGYAQLAASLREFMASVEEHRKMGRDMPLNGCSPVDDLEQAYKIYSTGNELSNVSVLEMLGKFCDERESASLASADGRDECDPVIKEEQAIRDTIDLFRQEIKALRGH